MTGRGNYTLVENDLCLKREKHPAGRYYWSPNGNQGTCCGGDGPVQAPKLKLQQRCSGALDS